MKNLLIILILLFPINVGAEECSENFSWLPNTESNLAGYRIYYDVTPDTYSKSVDIGLPETIDGRVNGVVPNLLCGNTYYFVCIAYNDNELESEYSDLVTVNVISITPAAPKDFRVENKGE